MNKHFNNERIRKSINKHYLNTGNISVIGDLDQSFTIYNNKLKSRHQKSNLNQSYGVVQLQLMSFNNTELSPNNISA